MLAGIVVIILGARIGGHLFESIGQPGVLGELCFGVLLGNLSLLGIDALDFLKVDYSTFDTLILHNYLHCAGVSIDHLARIGVLLLLFQIGLETNLADLKKVGWMASLVAFVGVITPMALGWLAAAILLPDEHWAIHMFLGATLTATSVGITARVFRDLGKTQTPEARIILGAAVIDDVLGLVVLAVAQGVIVAVAQGDTEQAFSSIDAGIVFGKAVVFLAGAIVLGQFVSRPLFRVASWLRGSGLLIVTALAICFSFSWLADEVGLAPIVGAFAAGLILDKVQYRELAARDGQHELEELVKPLADLFVPIFFVMMGVQVQLQMFASFPVLALAATLTVVAVLGKQACSLAVWDRNVNRWSVGVGMIPRGEVGIIFASIGHQMRIGDEPVIDNALYAAVLLMVMLTTFVTPPALKRLLV